MRYTSEYERQKKIRAINKRIKRNMTKIKFHKKLPKRVQCDLCKRWVNRADTYKLANKHYCRKEPPCWEVVFKRNKMIL